MPKKELYSIPNEYFYRLHHIRPRFKYDVENVLFFIANEIAKLQPNESSIFNKQLEEAIRMYPENLSKEQKTIRNWRTEICSLFGLVEYKGGIFSPGRMAVYLSQKNDLIQFFRYFLFYFQYPGGHLKPHETLKMIKAGICFKPVKYILEVMIEGLKADNKKYQIGLSKAEVAHLIFNDLRVTKKHRNPKETLNIIIEAKVKETKYDVTGDVIRYAGDILDYMVLGDLLKVKPDNCFYLNMLNIDVINKYIQDDSYFDPYLKLYSKKDLSLLDVLNTQEDWFKYINNLFEEGAFKTDITSLFDSIEPTESPSKLAEFIKSFLKRLNDKKLRGSFSTKEIGDIGEAIIIEHEKKRISKLGRQDFLHNIRKIPNNLAVGYDIESYEGDINKRRYIEVKTTISKNKISIKNFNLSASEWTAANTLRENYYIYRLMISEKDMNLFIIKDPVLKYKTDLIEVVPTKAVVIYYKNESGSYENLLI